MVHNTHNAQFERVSCNQCGADNAKLIYHKFGVDISRCRSCGLCYVGPMRPRQEVIWQRYSPNYFWDEYLPAHLVVDGKYDPDVHDSIYASKVHTIEPYKKFGPLLEVGSGGGLFLKAAERAGWPLVRGIEISEAAVKFSRENLGLDVTLGTIESTQFAQSTFGCVALLDTIEHLLDPKRVLQTIHTLLSPGGALIISTPNFNGMSRFFLDRSWAVLSPLEHLYYFTEQTLGQMLRQTGFVNIEHMRRLPMQTIYYSINPHNCHDPDSLRAKIYRQLFARFGSKILPWIKQIGIADELYFIAEKPAV